MMYGQTPQDIRQFFVNCWKKHMQKELLQPLEKQIVEILLAHPEYQAVVASGEVNAAYFPELGQSNPFLHMGLHLTLRDQIATDRPVGIAAIFQSLLQQYQDFHAVEHLIIECLAECLWQAQRQQMPPNDIMYLQACQALIKQPA